MNYPSFTYQNFFANSPFSEIYSQFSHVPLTQKWIEQIQYQLNLSQIKKQYEFQFQSKNFQQKYQPIDISQTLKIETGISIKTEGSGHFTNVESESTDKEVKSNLKNEFISKKEEALSPVAKIEGFSFSNSSHNSTKNLALDYSKERISHLILFFVSNFGKMSQDQIGQERSRYVNDPSFLELFDILSQKYVISAKCRDDMVRHSIRKALTFIRTSLQKELNLNAKEASLALCKRFFLPIACEKKTFNQTEPKIEEFEDKIVSFFLPYKKQSRNKTPNGCFIGEAFLSEKFLQAYVQYLCAFDEIMKRDNQKKVKKFVDFVYDCMVKQALYKVKKYRRLPWLASWIESTKIIAHELLDSNIREKIKRIKTKQHFFGI